MNNEYQLANFSHTLCAQSIQPPLSNFPRSAPESIKFLKYSGAKFLVNKIFVIFMGLIFVEGPISDYIVYHMCPRFCMLNFMLQAKPAKPTKLSTN